MKKNTIRPNPSPRNNWPQKTLDIGLGITILASALFIGYRILHGPDRRAESSPPVEMRSTQLAPVPIVQRRTGPILPRIDDSVWQRITSDPALRAARVQRADGCADTFGRIQWGFSTNTPERILQIRENVPQVLSGLKDLPCFEVGQKLPIFTFNEEPNSPTVTYLATMTVVDIISIKVANIPDSYFTAQETTAAAFADYIAAKRPPSLREYDNIIRLASPRIETLATNQVPAVVKNAKTIYRSELAAFRARYPNARIVDVRSPTEFAAGSLTGAVNIPFTPLPLGSNAFSWTVLNKDLTTSTFNFSTVLNMPIDQPIVVVGGPPTDGRAFWALLAFKSLRTNLYFLYDGLPQENR